MHKEFVSFKPDIKKAVLFIHGILGTPRHFDDFIPLVPAGYNIFNVLLDGHGGDPPLPGVGLGQGVHPLGASRDDEIRVSGDMGGEIKGRNGAGACDQKLHVIASCDAFLE